MSREKRSIDIRLIVETDLDNEELTEICMQAGHDLTKRVEGRMMLMAGATDKTVWEKLGIPEKPKPDAPVVWKPK